MAKLNYPKTLDWTVGDKRLQVYIATVNKAKMSGVEKWICQLSIADKEALWDMIYNQQLRVFDWIAKHGGVAYWVYEIRLKYERVEHWTGWFFGLPDHDAGADGRPASLGPYLARLWRSRMWEDLPAPHPDLANPDP